MTMNILKFTRFVSERSFDEFLRFVIVGILNTTLTYALYVLLNMALAYQIAYTISFVAGIFLSAQLNAHFTFGTGLNTLTLFRFGVVFFLNYCVGLGLLAILVDYFRWHEAAAPIAVLLATVPIGFLGSKYVLTRKSTTSL